MKKILISLMALMLFGNSVIFAAEISDSKDDTKMEEEIKDIDMVMATMMHSQNVSDEKDIDCSKVSNEDFEALGESIMEKMAGSNEAHEIMDKMMGGEGSEQLKNTHESLGKQYLGCSKSKYGMMGYSPIGMMGSYYKNGDKDDDEISNTYAQGSMMDFGGREFFAFVILKVIGALIFLPFIIYLSSKAWHAGANAANRTNNKKK